LSNEVFESLLCELPEMEMKRRSLNEELKCLHASSAILRKPFSN
jgi:hypothetical protein